MPQNDDEENMTLAEQIIRYLDSHPDAADGLEGIAKWWIPHQQYIESIEKVQKALNYLIKNRIIKRKTLSDGSVIYAKKNGYVD